ncbi:diguanylate cyclase [Vibrio sp.]|uniref:GGDEF domain-containing protein n=1 Tax=Vibrio sp. TaxID=678 RepID=UPI003D10ABD0
MKQFASRMWKMAIIWLIVSVIPILYYYQLKGEAQQFLLTRLESEGLQFLSYVDARATRVHKQLHDNIRQVTRSSLLRDFAHNRSPVLRRYIENEWYLLSSSSKMFYQLRYLDTAGQEVVRVDFTQPMSEPYIVPADKLQDKSGRDYFSYARQLSEGELGYFGIDLEQEHGQPVQPYRPGFRILYPVGDPGQRYGYFIANLEIFALAEQISQNDLRLDVEFISNDGYYLISPDRNKLFGDLIYERHKFNLSLEHPDLWQQMQNDNNNSGYHYDAHGLFVYKTFDNQLFATRGGMYIVTQYPPDMIAAELSERQHTIILEALTLWLIFGILSGGGALLLESAQRKNVDRIFGQHLFDSDVAVAITDAKHRILRANSKLCQLLGTEAGILRRKDLVALSHPRNQAAVIQQSLNTYGKWRGELTLSHKNGQDSVCKVEARVVTGSWRATRYFIYTLTDITEQHRMIQTLKAKSEHDDATGLWNKAKFDDTLLHHCKLLQRYPNQPQSCLALVDIDDFKRVNDQYGHQVGDLVIAHVAESLQELLRSTDFIARIGGDEFAVIILHTQCHQAARLMSRLCEAIANWHTHQVTVSIGIAQLDKNDDQTFRNADEALYRAKAKGKNCVIVHGDQTLSVV